MIAILVAAILLTAVTVAAACSLVGSIVTGRALRPVPVPARDRRPTGR